MERLMQTVSGKVEVTVIGFRGTREITTKTAVKCAFVNRLLWCEHGIE